MFRSYAPMHSRRRVSWLVLGAIVALGLATWLSYSFIDANTPQWCRAYTRDWAKENPWAQAVKPLGRPLVPLWLLFLLAWATTGRKRIVVTGVLAMLLASLVVFSAKAVVMRERPGRLEESKPIQAERHWWPGTSAFPSGDTAVAFASATVFAGFITLWWSAIPFLLAAGVGMLRVFGAHHYPSDAFAGAAVGIVCGCFAFYLVRRRFNRQRPGRSPPNFWRRAGWGFAILLLLPLLDRYDNDHPFITFFNAFGPFIACALLIGKGEAWLRWLRYRGTHRANPADSPVIRARAAGMVLVLIGALAVLPNLSWTTLYGNDEGYYAECAREMIVRGDPFVPHFAGKPWLEKPPLTFWFMAIAMKIIGQTELAARLPSALAGLLAMWLTFQLGSRMYSSVAGSIAALILGTSLLFGVLMRVALLDTVLVCCVLLSMLGLWRLFTRQKRWGVVMFYTGCGLGVLAKGPLGLALPIISLVGILAWTRRWRLLLEMRPLPGALLVLGIIGAWAIPASVLSGGEYFYELVWVRTIRPVFFPLQGHGGQNLLGYLALLPAYIPILFFALTPWCILLVPAIRRMGCEGWRSDRAGFLGGWVVAQLAILSVARTKLPHHVLPLLPAMAIVIGVFLADALQRPAELGKVWSHIRRKVLVVGAFVLSVIMLMAPIVIGFPREWPWFLPAALIAPIAACRVVSHLKYRRYYLAHMALVTGLLLFFAFVWQIGMPSLEKGKASWQVASFLKKHYGEKQLSSVRIARKSFHQPSLLFYLGESVERLSDTEDIDRFLQINEPAVVILPEDKLHQAISEGLAAPYEVLWRESVWIPGKIKWQPLVIIKNKSNSDGLSRDENNSTHFAFL